MGVSKTVFYDLQRLFAIRTALGNLELTAPPTTVFLYSHPQSTRLSRVGVLCGSFDPLTRAHVVLAQLARERFHLDQVFFTLAKVTVDKEQVSGLSLEDRLFLLSLLVQRREGLGVALVNRGLYVEQAQAFLDVPWDRVAEELDASQPLSGALDLSIVSVGEATRAGDRSVRIPLVLGDTEGQTTSVVLTIQIDPLIGEPLD